MANTLSGHFLIGSLANLDRRVWEAAIAFEIKTSNGLVEEPDAVPPDREVPANGPWHHRLTLERQVRARTLSESKKPTSAAHEVWVKDRGSEIARFADILGEVKVCAVSPVDTCFAVGDNLGSFYVLRLENALGS